MSKPFQHNFKGPMKSRTATLIVGILAIMLTIIFSRTVILLDSAGESQGWKPTSMGTIEQSDWSGGAASDRIFGVPDNSFSKSSNIDVQSEKGVIKLKGY